MNKQMYIFIALGIIFFIYLIYYFFIMPSTGLIPFVNLNVSNKSLSSTISPIVNSTNYTYCMWINVNTWTNNKKFLIYRGNCNGCPSENPSKNYDFLLNLDIKTPSLYCSFGSSSLTTGFKKYTLTSIFPIQKWVCIVIVLDGMHLDFYMDGKLSYSTLMNYLPISPSKDINFGNPVSSGSDYIGNDIFIANFNILNYPFDPNTAMNYYNTGSGQPSNVRDNYKANLSLLKNNTPSASISLF